jgi:predicted small secreted protein
MLAHRCGILHTMFIQKEKQTMVFVIIAAVLVGGVVLVGGGHTVQGFGQDIQQTGDRIQNSGK